MHANHDQQAGTCRFRTNKTEFIDTGCGFGRPRWVITVIVLTITAELLARSPQILHQFIAEFIPAASEVAG